MSVISIYGSELGSALEQILMCPDIAPGDEPSYQMCKMLYLYHPLAPKLVDGPIEIAQSQQREITIPDGPEGFIKEAYEQEWQNLMADVYIAQAAGISRVYGASSIIMGAEGYKPEDIIPIENLYKLDIFFNILDPLNTSGSMVYNQNPNSPNFQKPQAIQAQGQKYHPSRTIVTFNENPIYLSYVSSAFGYVGRSVFQRCLYNMKSFIKTMIADDMVATKSGLLVAKMKQPGGWVDQLMSTALGIKRALLNEAKTYNTISIDVDESIETLNMMNVNQAMAESRKNILNNIATSNVMPAALLNEEAFAQGFADGTEDAKVVARYIDRFRQRLNPLYIYFDRICMHRAWNPDFYKDVQAKFDEYKGITYNTAFYRWRNSFKAHWPSLLIEPESDQSEMEKVKNETIISTYESLKPDLDPQNKIILIQWVADNINNNKLLFQNPLVMDYDELENYIPEEQAEKTEENIDETGSGASPKPKKLQVV